MQLSSLREMITRAMGGSADMADPADPDKSTVVPNRVQLRAQGFRGARTGSGAVHRVLARGPRIRYGKRTGRTAHHQSWLAEAVVQRHLQTMRTAWLASRSRLDATDAKLAATLRLLDAAGYDNVLKVARADRSDLLAVKGVGRVGLRNLHTYLSEHQVPLSWEV